MFIQVIQGKVADPAAVKAASDQWSRDLAPDANGFLGATEGVTDDGRFIALVRFENEEAARANSNRREQDAWWKKTSKLFTEPPTFIDSTDVMLDLVGDPDEAQFVQVMQGRGTNPERARELMSESSPEWADFRPDVLGSVGVMHGDGGYTMAIYFTNEAEAREGEKKTPPPSIQAQMDELNALNVGQPEFFDLRDPWLYVPK
jgi:hypothetical protein